MSKDHAFTFNVDPDPLQEGRYRWQVCEGVQIRLRSPHSYPSKEDATQEASKAAERLSAVERER